jgi:hypothetical protein
MSSSVGKSCMIGHCKNSFKVKGERNAGEQGI